MKHTDVKVLFAESGAYENKSVTVCGWVRTWRDSKGISFIELNDGTCLKNLQLVIEKTIVDENTVKPALATGTALKVVGIFIPSERPRSWQSLPLSLCALPNLSRPCALYTSYPLLRRGLRPYCRLLQAQVCLHGS